MIKFKKIKVKDWIIIERFEEQGYIKLKNGNIIKIIKVDPINYNLKSDLEKSAILNSYKLFLKTCNFNIQILIQSKKQDITNHTKKIKENIKKTNNLKIIQISQKYIKYINDFNSSKKTSSKNFYIILSKNIKELENLNSKEIIQNELKENYFKIKECLARSGNTVKEISNIEENIEIINSFYNTRKNLKKGCDKY